MLATSEKPRARCLSVNTEKGVWHCHHCGWAGSLKQGIEAPGRRPIVRPSWTPPSHVDPRVLLWGDQRAIPETVLRAEGIALQRVYMPQVEDEADCLAFPYRKGGEVVNVKYRTLEGKHFRQVAGAEKVLYRQDRIAREHVVIVEGEVDALSVVAAGLDSVVSVPDGAPPPNAKHLDGKFAFLEQDPDPFAGVQRILLAVDADAPGQTLAAELARRLGRDRCWLVTWPSDCKDANEVLVAYESEELRACLNRARPWPIEDVVEVVDVVDDVLRLYDHGPRGAFDRLELGERVLHPRAWPAHGDHGDPIAWEI